MSSKFQSPLFLALKLLHAYLAQNLTNQEFLTMIFSNIVMGQFNDVLKIANYQNSPTFEFWNLN